MSICGLNSFKISSIDLIIQPTAQFKSFLITLRLISLFQSSAGDNCDCDAQRREIGQPKWEAVFGAPGYEQYRSSTYGGQRKGLKSANGCSLGKRVAEQYTAGCCHVVNMLNIPL